jgi:hypothetical protein
MCRSKGKVYKLDRVLFDSGALSSSYIDQGLVDKFRDLWEDSIYEVDGEVKLADQTTTLKIKERALLELSFMNPNLMKTRAKVELTVMPMPGMDVIIGLPDILDSFLELFIDLLISARPDSLKLTHQHTSVHSTELIEPWSEPILDIAPEEEETEIPCSFSGPLYYLSKPHEQIIQDYKDLFETHIAKALDSRWTSA